MNKVMNTRIFPLTLAACCAAALAPAAWAVDSDADGLDDAADNCTLVANADQRDTDGDRYGNACDPDLNNDLVVNFTDLGTLKGVFFTSDPNADFDGDGAVNFVDLGVMKGAFFAAPGPSGLAEAPTYTEDVQPIFFEKCDFCHTGKGYGGHNIGINYEDAFLPADNFAECFGLLVGQCTIIVIQEGKMPPGSICTGDPEQDAGNPDCLTQEEQDTVQAWIDAGMPE
jgi:hypothetical protein